MIFPYIDQSCAEKPDAVLDRIPLNESTEHENPDCLNDMLMALHSFSLLMSYNVIYVDNVLYAWIIIRIGAARRIELTKWPMSVLCIAFQSIRFLGCWKANDFMQLPIDVQGGSIEHTSPG